MYTKSPLVINTVITLIGYIIVTAIICISIVALYATLWVFIYYIAPFFVLLYILIGKRLNNKNSKNDILRPIIFLWFIILISWVVCYISEPRVNILQGTYDSKMFIYAIANPSSMIALVGLSSLIDEGSKVLSDILGIISTAIPPLFIWLGVYGKKCKLINESSNDFT